MFSTPAENSRTWKILKDPHTYTICGFFHMTVTAPCGYQLDRHLWPVLLTNKAFANSEPTFLDKSRWICLSVFCLNELLSFYQAEPIIWKASVWGGEILRPNLQISPTPDKRDWPKRRWSAPQTHKPTNRRGETCDPVITRVRNKLRSFETHIFTSNIILFNFKHP